jgi:hypothetical protein
MRSSFIAPTSPPAGTEVDGRWKNWLVDVTATHNLRDIRGNLLALAYQLTKEPAGAQAACVLVGSKITQDRLATELAMFRVAVRPSLGSRVHLAQLIDDRLVGLQAPSPDFTEWLQGLVGQRTAPTSTPGSSQQVVLAFLLRSWLARSGPLSTTAIQSAVGASYPTVAKVLKQLEAAGTLSRTPDRRIEMRAPSLLQWRNWIATQASTRKTIRFADPAGTARSPEAMAQRLFKLGSDDVAVGGVLGARHHFADLNITGSLRLDLTVHRAAALAFIRKLDAGLVETQDPQAKAVVVVHRAHGPNLGFVKDAAGLWADPLECLIDLHVLGLDEQADEMLKNLVQTRNQ